MKKGTQTAYVACAALILLSLAIIGIVSFKKNSVVPAATSLDELAVAVSYGENEEYIRIWKSEEGIYYCFLPTGSLNHKVVFANAPKSGELLLDGVSVTAYTDLSKTANNTDDVHEIEFTHEDGQVENGKIEFMCSSQIATAFIETESGSLDYLHEDRTNFEKGDITLFDETGKMNYQGRIEGMHCRGNSSFEMTDKKSYSVNLKREASLLQMDTSKKWVLIANSFDSSYIRNKLALEYCRENSVIPATESEYLDLYINGEYAGNYLLCHYTGDSVNMGAESDMERKMKALNTQGALENAKEYRSEDGGIHAYSGLTDPEDITGCYIIEANGVSRGRFRCGFTTKHGNYYEVVYPDKATVKQVEYICGYMNEAEDAIYAEDGINPTTGKSYSDYLDIESWSQKYVIDQLFTDYDKNESNRSVLFYKFSDSVDSHLYSGPAWDYDLSAGSYVFGEDYYKEAPLYPLVNDGAYAENLSQKEDVKNCIKTYMQNEVSEYLEDNTSAQIRRDSKLIADSADMDSVLWSNPYKRFEDRAAEYDYIRWYLSERFAFLDDLWCRGGVYHTVSFIGPSGEVCNSYSVKHGEYCSQIPTVTSLGAVFAGWTSSGKKAYPDSMPILEDTVFESQWVDMDLLILNGLTLGDGELEDIEIETLEAILERAKQLKGADGKEDDGHEEGGEDGRE